MIADEEVAISITHTGYIKRTSISTYRSQRRGGRGRVGMKTQGRGLRQQPLHRLHPLLHPDLHRPGAGLLAQGPRDPRRGPPGQGQGGGEPRPAPDRGEDRGLLRGQGLRRRGLRPSRHPPRHRQEDRARGLRQPPAERHHRPCRSRTGDALIDAVLTSGTDKILLGTREGMAIHFSEEDVRPMGRTAYGVKGIELDEGDQVVSLEVVRSGHHAHRDRERLRQAHPARRVPRAEPGRQGTHQHQDRGSQRPGGGGASSSAATKA